MDKKEQQAYEKMLKEEREEREREELDELWRSTDRQVNISLIMSAAAAAASVAVFICRLLT